MYNPNNYKQVDEYTKVWDLSTDINEFEKVMKDHILNVIYKDYKEGRERSENINVRKCHRSFTYLFDNMKEGDILQHYIWDAGILAYSEGFYLERDGEVVARATLRVS